ncbi:MAG: hypothetical protein K0Q72_3736, partial [Armatimonadetes bacterium]|nr:hypothetical protein [Armatimonadota bacterium]
AGSMRILYGVVGEGMGHAVRSRVVLDYLLEQGHELLIVVSGRAHGFLTRHFVGRKNVRVELIHGLHLTFEGSVLDVSESVADNLEELPANLATNFDAYRRVIGSQFKPQVAFSDFDYWAYLYGRRHGIPVISIDNMQVIDRCDHDPELLEEAGFKFRLARMAVKMKLPGAYHYLVTSFFFPPVRKPRTTLIAPVLRPEVLALRREPGEHVLVYQTAPTNTSLIPMLAALPHEFRVYGMGREGTEGPRGNVSLRPFSEPVFLEDLRTARALLAGGGFTLLGEAVHLGVPVLSVPPAGYFEQELNARYLARLGYGRCASQLTPALVEAFLAGVPAYTRALQRYPAQDNTYLYRCVDELLRHIALGRPAPAVLSSAAIEALGRRGSRGGDEGMRG